jgi:hypothetical protein
VGDDEDQHSVFGFFFMPVLDVILLFLSIIWGAFLARLFWLVVLWLLSFGSRLWAQARVWGRQRPPPSILDKEGGIKTVEDSGLIFVVS